MQTIYDSVVFGLMVYKTAKDTFGFQSRSVGGVQALMAKHGVLYYAYVRFFSYFVDLGLKSVAELYSPLISLGR